MEVTNRTLLKIIKVRLEGAKGTWLEELLGVLWAYWTTARTPTRETPFKLAFGIETVILVKIVLSSLRQDYYDEDVNNEELKLNLDCLSELRDTATQRMARYQQKMSKYYD